LHRVDDVAVNGRGGRFFSRKPGSATTNGRAGSVVLLAVGAGLVWAAAVMVNRIGPFTTLTVEPPRQVRVRRGDRWFPGWLQAWRRDGDGWRAYVSYTVGVGMQHLN
jgi:hypothetical protein